MLCKHEVVGSIPIISSFLVTGCSVVEAYLFWEQGAVCSNHTNLKILFYMFFIILYTLNFFLIFSTTCIFLVENAVHSVFFLVLTFLNAAAICFLFGADFLGLLIIIIYVGAIAVLFLFVIMMLNAKTSVVNVTKILPLIFLIIITLFIQIYLFFTDLIIDFNANLPLNFLFESLSKEFFLGECLYNYFLVCFLLAGIVLLTGMIGAIVLTLNFDKKKFNQMPFRQLGRTDNFLSYF